MYERVRRDEESKCQSLQQTVAENEREIGRLSLALESQLQMSQQQTPPGGKSKEEDEQLDELMLEVSISDQRVQVAEAESEREVMNAKISVVEQNKQMNELITNLEKMIPVSNRTSASNCGPSFMFCLCYLSF